MKSPALVDPSSVLFDLHFSVTVAAAIMGKPSSCLLQLKDFSAQGPPAWEHDALSVFRLPVPLPPTQTRLIQ